MPASIIAPAIISSLGITSVLGAAAVTFGVRLVTTLAISSLIARSMADNGQQVGQSGGQVQLPPATNNKLPVVYGDAWTSPIVTDVKLSTDQQTMWYVLAFSETTANGTISFDEVYWDDKILLFDPNNPNTIRGWYIPADDTTVTGVAGKISMYFYRNGSLVLGTTHHCVSEAGVGAELPTTVSAIQLLQDAGIAEDQRWTNSDLMSNTVFAVCKVVYDSDHGVTGLGSVRARVRNSLKQPGSVMRDYLGSTRYGAGVPLSQIDVDSFNALDVYSASQLSLTNVDGVTVDSGNRYEINGIVDTARDCLNNLVLIADSADSWLQWNESKGQWGAVMNRGIADVGITTGTIFKITADNIIGGIQVNPLDLNSTYNAVDAQFPNTNMRDQMDQRYYALPSGSRFANEPNNTMSIQMPLVNNSLQATYLAYKKLFSSRTDLIINFTMDYSGIQVDAGDIVCVNHDWYGWTSSVVNGETFPGKLFRVTQIREAKDSSGFLSVQISAIAYNDEVFTTTNPHYYTPVSFSSLADPSYITKPPAPTVPQVYVDSTVSTFVVQGDIPAQGNVNGMEFWYSTNGSDFVGNNYTLYSTQNYAQGPLYPHFDTNNATFFEQVRTNYLPAGTYYWRTRAQGPQTTSAFSDASTAFVWAPSTGRISGTQIDDDSIAGSKVISGDPQKTGGDSGGFFDSLGDIALLGLGAASIWYANEQGWFGEKEEPYLWAGKGGGNEYGNDTTVAGLLWSDNPEPAVGDTVTYYADATPYPGDDLYQYASFNDYDVAPSNYEDPQGDWWAEA
jgi:hypothetical protein